MDYGDVVVHIFDEQTRTYYALEKLWGDAARVPFGVRPEGLEERRLHEADDTLRRQDTGDISSSRASTSMPDT